MDNNIYKRIAALVGLALSLFLLPWWITTVFGICFVLFFKNPYEVFLLGIFLDGLYGTQKLYFVYTHIFFIGTVVVFLISMWIKEHLMFRI